MLCLTGASIFCGCNSSGYPKRREEKGLEEGRELSVVRPCVYWCMHIILVFKVVLASMHESFITNIDLLTMEKIDS